MGALAKLNKINTRRLLLVAYLSSFMLVQFSLNVGFSFKPYMMISLVLALISLRENREKEVIRDYKMTKCELCLILFVLFATIRNCFADDILLAFKGSIALLFSLLIYFFTVYSFKDFNNESIFRFIYQSGVINLLIIAIGFILGDNRIFELDRTVSRLRGYVQDPNFFTLYLILPLFIFLFYVIRDGKKRLLTMIMLGLLFLSYSRAAYICATLGIFYLLILLKNKIPHFYRKIIVLSFFGVTGLWIFSSLPITKPIWDNIIQNIDSRLYETASRSARELLLEIGINVFKENPVFGVGMLNVRYYTYALANNNYLHNTYLEVFAEQGIIGGLLYLGFILNFLFYKCNNIHSKVVKAVVVCELMMIFFLSAVNNETFFLSMGIFRSLNLKKN